MDVNEKTNSETLHEIQEKIRGNIKELSQNTTIELDITPEKLDEMTWEQWEKMEKAPNVNSADARSILSVFVKGMTPEEGYAALGKLKTRQMNETLFKFVEVVNKLKAVNPPSGG